MVGWREYDDTLLWGMREWWLARTNTSRKNVRAVGRVFGDPLGHGAEFTLPDAFSGFRGAFVRGMRESGRDERNRMVLSWGNANHSIGLPAKTHPDARISRGSQATAPGNSSKPAHPAQQAGGRPREARPVVSAVGGELYEARSKTVSLVVFVCPI